MELNNINKVVQRNKDNTCRYALYKSTYNKSLTHVLALVAEARNDFPELQDDDISIVVYGGERIRKMMGVEFNRPGEPNSRYFEVHALEYTLA